MGAYALTFYIYSKTPLFRSPLNSNYQKPPSGWPHKWETTAHTPWHHVLRDIYGSVFGKRDLLSIFHVMKCDAKCGTCLHKCTCRQTTFSNAANHFEIFLIEFEICLYKHLYFLYIRSPLFPIADFISMLLKLKVHMFYPKNSFPIA